MNDMERRKFEDSFKDAFHEAEAAPSENVWTNIELDLEKAEGGKMKRRLLFFKLLAAASVAFAMAVAGAGYYTMNVAPRNEQIGASASDPQDQSSHNNPAATENPNPLASAPDKAQPEPIQRRSTASDPAVKETPEAVKEATSGVVSSQGNTSSVQAPDDLSRRALATNSSSQEASSTKSSIKKDQPGTISGERSLAERSSSGNTKDKSVLPSNAASAQEKDQSLKDQGQRSQAALAVNQNPTESITAPPSGTASSPDGQEQVSNAGAASADQRLSFQKILLSPNGAVDNATSSGNSSGSLAERGMKTTGTDNEREGELLSISTGKGLPALVNPEKVVFTQEEQSTPDPFALMMARLAEKERAMAKEDEEEKSNAEKLWTSVGMAAGGFNTVNGSVSQSTTSTFSSDDIADQQSKASGVAYSFGVSVGKRLSERWVLQGGVNYLNQSSNYTANGLVGSSDMTSFSAASVNALGTINSSESRQDARYLPTSPYSVNNSLAFVSVPLQAGYLIVNKKFGVQLNAGISTDLFLQNTLTPQADGLEKTTQGSGEDSPYRTLNFSGLVGTEFSYKLGKHYRLALNPGLRYPFNSIYKSDIGLQAMPLTFDVGLKFRYIFR